MVEALREAGPLRGLTQAYRYIDNASRDDVVHYICPDKYRASNFLPSRTGGTGSTEFRRPPGVVTAKKAKHWIAFTMTFVEMAIQFNPSALAAYLPNPFSHFRASMTEFWANRVDCNNPLAPESVKSIGRFVTTKS